ncbi:efflux RND transporter periplasmic adaptor subunit [soil metagenome]
MSDNLSAAPAPSPENTPQQPFAGPSVPVQKGKVRARKKKSKKKKYIFIGAGILIVLIIIAIVVSGKKEKITDVQTEKIIRRNITQVVTATGKIQSETKVNISAETSGEIISLPFKEGDEVKKGDLLAKIKQDAYAPQIAQQNASIKVAESNLAQNEVALKNLQLDLNRTKELVSKGLASQSELDNAENKYEQQQAILNTNRAQINQQRAGLGSIKYDVSKTTIYAPMSGVITKLNNEVGEKVLGTVQNIGSNIMTISDLSLMECQVDVSEADVTMIHLGDTANVTVDAFSDKIFKGYVYEVANSATSKGTGTQEEVVNFTVKIRIIGNEFELRPGMSCTASIDVAKKFNVLSVPIQSITIRDESMMNGNNSNDKSTGNENLTKTNEQDKKKKIKPQEIVFIVENGTVKKKNVKSGISDDTYIEIIDGVNENSDVVKGSYKAINTELEDNAKVKVDNSNKSVKPGSN